MTLFLLKRGFVRPHNLFAKAAQLVACSDSCSRIVAMLCTPLNNLHFEPTTQASISSYSLQAILLNKATLHLLESLAAKHVCVAWELLK